ncbi:uncharacterized protein TNCV_1232031 [Trichonephila clavipes]|nr:uncharacterized protein TNCV_1232031 [Trichonephila clavipes]
MIISRMLSGRRRPAWVPARVFCIKITEKKGFVAMVENCVQFNSINGAVWRSIHTRHREFSVVPYLKDNRTAAVAEWYRYRIVACLVTSSIPVPLKTRRVGQRCTLNLSRAETSSRWCGVVVRRGGCQLRCRPRHLTMVQNYVVRRQKPSCS